jgi:hypothetical protein
LGQYATYLSQVRSLLHDPQGNGWSDATLVGYINEGRRRLAKDTYCLRDLNTGLVLTAGTERYLPLTFITPLPAYARSIAGVISIDLYYGNTRYPLTYIAWRQFSKQLRYWQSLLQLPVAWSYLGANAIYFGPIPDQAYVTDWDVAYIPVDLTSDAQAEPIPLTYVDAVPWWAARLAKANEQSLGEAKYFEQEYFAQLGLETAAFARFRYAPR